MADWSNYLKNAVANVEQQLDKVLLENQERETASGNTKSEPKRAVSAVSVKSSRPDLSERLRRAAIGRSVSPAESGDTNSPNPEAEKTGTPDLPTGNTQNEDTKATSKDVAADINHAADFNNTMELLTSTEFVTAPDLAEVLNKARQVALALKREDTLQVVDDLEKAQIELDRYIDNISDRMKSLGSKILLLSREHIDNSSGSDKKIALLMEEGHRLSKRELELNLAVKKLRAERSAALVKADQLSAKDAEIEQLKGEINDQKQKIRDSEALTEHYRSLSEINSTGIESKTRDGNREEAKTVQADAIQKRYTEEREKWRKLEGDLLSRIAELEQTQDMRHSTMKHLQQRLNEAQRASGMARNEVTELQEELDATREKYTTAESRMRVQIDDLTSEIASLKLHIQRIEREGQEQAEQATRAIQAANELQQSRDSDGPLVPVQSHDINLTRGSLPVSPEGSQAQLNDSRMSLSPLMGPQSPSIESEMPLSHLDQVTVGPAGPFGALADNFDPDHNPLSEPRDDNFSVADTPRRESSMFGSESMQGSHIHLVRKLTMSVRKLENELSSASKVTELLRAQRDEAQSELVGLIEAQEQLEQVQDVHRKLQEAYDALMREAETNKNNMLQKEERISELEADVQDLKEMYKEQIEALITEVETLRRK